MKVFLKVSLTYSKVSGKNCSAWSNMVARHMYHARKSSDLSFSWIFPWFWKEIWLCCVCQHFLSREFVFLMCAISRSSTPLKTLSILRIEHSADDIFACTDFTLFMKVILTTFNERKIQQIRLVANFCQIDHWKIRYGKWLFLCFNLPIIFRLPLEIFHKYILLKKKKSFILKRFI